MDTTRIVLVRAKAETQHVALLAGFLKLRLHFAKEEGGSFPCLEWECRYAHPKTGRCHRRGFDRWYGPVQVCMVDVRMPSAQEMARYEAERSAWVKVSPNMSDPPEEFERKRRLCGPSPEPPKPFRLYIPRQLGVVELPSTSLSDDGATLHADREIDVGRGQVLSLEKAKDGSIRVFAVDTPLLPEKAMAPAFSVEGTLVKVFGMPIFPAEPIDDGQIVNFEQARRAMGGAG